MVPKNKLLRLYTLQNRFESIIQDFYNDSEISSDIVFELDTIKSSLSNFIEDVRSKS